MNSHKLIRRNAFIAVILCMGCVIAMISSGCIAHPHNISGISNNSDSVDEAREKVLLEGVVSINDTSTGCWCFQADDGRTYEPLFCLQEPLELKPGMKLRLCGHVEPDAPQTCGFGPVFYAEQTQIVGLAMSINCMGSK